MIWYFNFFNISRTCFLLSHLEGPIKRCNEGMCITGISDCSINRQCGIILANGSFTDGGGIILRGLSSDSTVTALALGNCDPVTITLVGHGGRGNFL